MKLCTVQLTDVCLWRSYICRNYLSIHGEKEIAVSNVLLPLAISSLCRNAILHSIISKAGTVRQEDLTRDSKRSNEQQSCLLLSENKFKAMPGSQLPFYFIRSIFQRYLPEIITQDSNVSKSKQNSCQKAVSLANSHWLQGTHYELPPADLWTDSFKEITIGRSSVHLLWHSYLLLINYESTTGYQSACDSWGFVKAKICQ